MRIDDPWTQLRELTAARIALGRAGHSLPTRELLAFQLAHAKARDAVWCPLDVTSLAGLSPIVLHSAARDRAEYLRRPDLGRRLAAESAGRIERGEWDAVIVIADGLSATAVHRHARVLVDGLLTLLLEQGVAEKGTDHSVQGRYVTRREPSTGRGQSSLSPLPACSPDQASTRVSTRHAKVRAPQGAESSGWRIAPIFVVEQGRVALGDEIGERIGAGLALVIIGERPGLSSPDSLGAYMTWSPRVGRTDAERNCVSNIRVGGLAPETAAVRIAQLMQAARQQRVTGVNLASPEAPGRVLSDR